MDHADLLPDVLRIGAAVYKFVPRSALWYAEEGCHGTTEFDLHEINIATEDRPLSEVLDTMVHEVLHVCWKEWYLGKRPREEPAVTKMATALCAVFSQNPEYLEAISIMTGSLNDE